MSWYSDKEEPSKWLLYHTGDMDDEHYDLDEVEDVEEDE